MGLIAWFSLDGKLDNKGTGNYTISSSSSSYETGKVTQKSIRFNGNQMYFTNPFVNKNEWSLSFWWKNNGSGDWTDVFTFNGGSSRLEIFNSNKSWNWYCNDTSTEDIFDSGTNLGDGVFTTGVWYNVIITFNNGVSTFYIDGVQKVQQAGKKTFTSGSSQLYFGSRIGGMYANMNLNDVRCYDHCLSNVEIKNLTKALVLHYNFEDLYTPLDYIEFSGTQFIRTGISSLTTPYSVETTFNKTNTSTADQCLFGQRQLGKFSNIYNTYFENDPLAVSASNTVPTNRKATLVVTNTSVSIDGTTLVSSSDVGNRSTSYEALIGAFSEHGYANAKWFFQGRIYEMKIINAGALYRHFIPTMRNIDGNVGLYDKVTCTFYGNAGTGTFGYGTNRINEFQNSMLNEFTTGSTNQIYNTVTDTRTYFDFQIQTFNGGTYITNVLNAGSLTAGNRYSFVVNNTSMSSSTTRLRLKHNGSVRDITIAYVPVDYTKSYVVSFTVLSANPTTTGNSGIRLEDLKVMEIPEIEDKSGYGVNATLRCPGAFSATNDARIGTTSLRSISGDPNARINTSLSPSFIDNGTICFWYKKDSSAFSYNSGHFLVATQFSSGSFFGATADGLPFNSGCSYGTFYLDGVASSNSNIQDTNWHFYAFTGVNLTQWTSFSMQAHGDTSWLWRGNIADFKIYNTSLSSSDIKDLYETRMIIDNKGNIYCEKLIDKQSSCEFPNNEGLIKATDFMVSNEAQINGEYELLEYIESTGSQYIDTGVYYSESLSFDIDFSNFTSATSTYILGTENPLFGLARRLDNQIGWFSKSDQMYVYDSFSTNGRYHVKCSSTGFSCNGVSSYPQSDSGNTTGSNTFRLFGGRYSTTPNSAYRLHSCKIYDRNILIRNYVPVKRKSDGVIGLFDKVEGILYTNKGSGTFVVGTSKGTCYMVGGKNIYEGMGVSVNPTIQKVGVPSIPTYTLSISNATGINLTVNRTSSDYGSTGVLSHGATLYEGDKLTISASGNSDYILNSIVVNGSSISSGATHTVSGNVTISTTATAKSWHTVWSGSSSIYRPSETNHNVVISGTISSLSGVVAGRQSRVTGTISYYTMSGRTSDYSFNAAVIPHTEQYRAENTAWFKFTGVSTNALNYQSFFYILKTDYGGVIDTNYVYHVTITKVEQYY